ncbi:conserved hypothetical protein [Nostoc punctiforme PCC 73102]|uniref:Transposase IS4-like domain-containing protein n=1 Tax=Nostoc punctiforme (strain ATCC 29133 / PCC 73102) TaxID=63737 RepID=B2J562_NOSP7|nr:conserved hypothetical protein [Nostoc punctiforme PCC 73102]
MILLIKKYKRIELLEWNQEELDCGKIIKIKGFPANKKVKLFRVTVSTNRTDYVATNDLSQSSTDVVQEVCKIRWNIEEFHREIKQLTGIEWEHPLLEDIQVLEEYNNR